MHSSPFWIAAGLLVLLATPARAEPDPVVLVELALDTKDEASSPDRLVRFRPDGGVEVHGAFGDAARGTATDVLVGKLTPDELATFRELIPALYATTRIDLPRAPSDVALTVTTKSAHMTSYSHAAGETRGLLARAGHLLEATVGLGDRLDPVTGLPQSVVKLRALADAVTKRFTAKLAAPARFEALEVVLPDHPSHTVNVRLDRSGDTTVGGATGTVATLSSEQVGKIQDLFRRADFARLPVVPSNLGVPHPTTTGSPLRIAATWSLGDGVTATRSVFVATDREGTELVPRLDAASAEAAPFMNALAALGSYAATASSAAADVRTARARVANGGVVPGVNYVDAPLFPHPGDRERTIRELTDQANSDDARIVGARAGFLERLATER